jgi:DNA-binding LytR/AlgR family response regulator
MKCIVVEDNKLARAVIRHQIKGIEFINLVAECENASQAKEILDKEKVDLLLLDINLPDISGIDLLKMLSARPLVILITARTEYAVEAFEHNVVDYILKPVKEDRFLKAIYRAKEIFDSNVRTLKSDKEYFFFREKGVASKLKISDILFIQAMGDYVTINTSENKYTVHYTLSAIEKELPSDKFMRVHRSYIVALDKIDTVEDGTIYIYQTNIPVSDKQRSNLMTRLNLL